MIADLDHSTSAQVCSVVIGPHLPIAPSGNSPLSTPAEPRRHALRGCMRHRGGIERVRCECTNVVPRSSGDGPERGPEFVRRSIRTIHRDEPRVDGWPFARHRRPPPSTVFARSPHLRHPAPTQSHEQPEPTFATIGVSPRKCCKYILLQDISHVLAAAPAPLTDCPRKIAKSGERTFLTSCDVRTMSRSPSRTPKPGSRVVPAIDRRVPFAGEGALPCSTPGALHRRPWRSPSGAGSAVQLTGNDSSIPSHAGSTPSGRKAASVW